MITYKFNGVKLTQTIYNESLEKNFYRLVCPSCNVPGHLIRHGAYMRNLDQEDGAFRLIVQRVKCKHCGHTHAVVPEIIIPYVRLSMVLVMQILTSLKTRGQLVKVVDQLNLDMDTVKSVIRRYRDVWERKLKSMQLEITHPVNEIIDNSFRHFVSQFMQVRRVYNKLFPLTT